MSEEQAAHSELGASVAARFFACPGSVILGRGMPNRSSVYAQAGTAAHAVGEMCLKSGQDTIEFIDRTVEGVVIDEATADNVQVYVDVCRETLPIAEAYGIEQRFDLANFDPPVPMFGTADFWSRHRREDGTRVLRIVDYKNGWLPVAAHENPQLRYYALGAMFLSPEPIDEIEAIIVQRDTPKRTTFDPIELVEWSTVLMRKARETQEPNAPLAAGAWCRFCPVSGQCAEQARAALSVAKMEFSRMPTMIGDAVDRGQWLGKPCEPCNGTGENEGDSGRRACGGCGGTGEAYGVPDEPEHRAVVGTPPDPKTLSPAEVGDMLDRVPILEMWIKALQDAATAEISRGSSVPGWKLVPTRPQAGWVDPKEAAAALAGLFEVEAYGPPEVLSPARARLAIASSRIAARAAAGGKKLTKKDAEASAKEDLKNLIAYKSSGLTLVSNSDTRDGAPVAGSEFSATPATTPKESK